MVRCEGPLSLAIDDVLEVRFCALELAAVMTGDVPCPRGIARGDEGAFDTGRGDMRAVAEISGEAEDAELLQNKPDQ